MSELSRIVSAYQAIKNKGQSCVLATVVHVEGSAYRQAGARMLVSENGLMTGAISGGCLEGNALKKALLALEQGEKKLVTYDTNDEDDAEVGAQLGCNGVIQVLFEPIFSHSFENNPMDLLQTAAQAQESMVLVTFFDLKKTNTQFGTRLLFDDTGKFSGNLPITALEAALVAEVRSGFGLQNRSFRTYELGAEKYSAFIETLLPPPNLVLVGAGNDAQPLALLAQVLGWNVTIADGRPTHANEQRFGSTCQIMVTKPERLLEQIPLNNRTALVLMTHNYVYDLAVLTQILSGTELPAYIGILGPKKKFQRMLEDLENAGIQPTAEQMNRIFAPVGLDVGAETSAEIGLSILSEIQAVLHSANGGHLRDLNSPIHDKSFHAFNVVTLGHYGG